MAKRTLSSIWGRAMQRSAASLGRQAVRAGTRAVRQAIKAAAAAKTAGPRRAGPVAGAGSWFPGLAISAAGARRYRLYRPAGIGPSERLPLLVMLHGCGQDADKFAASTRMNRLAERERFLVLYPEQDRLANAQGCWNWFDTRSGRAQREAESILAAVDQVCTLGPADHGRVAVAGLSAGASLAALLAARHPDRFKAVVMHSGIAPGSADSSLSALGAMRGRRAAQPLAPPSAAAATHWPALMVIQGSLDPLVATRNGAAAAQTWADAVGAVAGPSRSIQRGQRYPMTVTDYKVGGRLVATRVDIAGLAHAWSGGAAGRPFGDPRGPDASRLLWSFVARHLRD